MGQDAHRGHDTEEELDEEALESVSGGAAYLKIEGIDGESRLQQDGLERLPAVQHGDWLRKRPGRTKY